MDWTTAARQSFTAAVEQVAAAAVATARPTEQLPAANLISCHSTVSWSHRATEVVPYDELLRRQPQPLARWM